MSYGVYGYITLCIALVMCALTIPLGHQFLASPMCRTRQSETDVPTDAGVYKEYMCILNFNMKMRTLACCLGCIAIIVMLVPKNPKK